MLTGTELLAAESNASPDYRMVPLRLFSSAPQWARWTVGIFIGLILLALLTDNHAPSSAPTVVIESAPKHIVPSEPADEPSVPSELTADKIKICNAQSDMVRSLAEARDKGVSAEQADSIADNQVQMDENERGIMKALITTVYGASGTPDQLAGVAMGTCLERNRR
jgi:hypothetical protein